MEIREIRSPLYNLLTFPVVGAATLCWCDARCSREKSRKEKFAPGKGGDLSQKKHLIFYASALNWRRPFRDVNAVMRMRVSFSVRLSVRVRVCVRVRALSLCVRVCKKMYICVESKSILSRSRSITLVYPSRKSLLL